MFRLKKALVSGDTPSSGWCRVDYRAVRSKKCIDDLLLIQLSRRQHRKLPRPCHGGEHDTMAHLRRDNALFRDNDLKTFKQFFGTCRQCKGSADHCPPLPESLRQR